MRKFLFILFITGLITCTGHAFGQTSEEFQKIGDAFLGVRDFQSAQQNYTKAINKKGHDKNYMAILFGKRSECWLQLKEYDKCLEDCNQSIKLDSTIRGTYWNRGLVYDYMKNFQAAIDDYKKVATLLPIGQARNEAIIYVDIANDEFLLGAADKAVLADSIAINYDPHYSRAFWVMGTMNMAKKKYNEAVDDYTTAIYYFDGVQLQLSSLYSERAYGKMQQNKYKDAVNDFSYALTLNPDNRHAYWNRAATYHRNGDYKLAADDYTKAITYYTGDNKNLSLLYDDRASNEMGQDSLAEALKDDSLAITFNPENTSAYWNAASASTGSANYRHSIEVYKKLLNFYSTVPKAVAFIKSQMADNAYFLNSFDEAVGYCNDAIAGDSLSYYAYYTRAKISLKDESKKTQAIGDFTKVLQSDTSKKSVEYIFSLFYTGKGDVAVAQLQNDVLATTNTALVNGDYYNLACLYSLMKQPDEANVYLKKAIDSGYSKKYAAADVDLDNIRSTDDYKTIMAAPSN